MRHRAFTLIELLVVVAILGVLLSILLPSLSRARQAARTVYCLANFRSMETAHQMYINDHDGAFVDVGLGHGGTHSAHEAAWIHTLERYYGSELLHRSPVDDSPHWPADRGGDGVPVPPTSDHFRRTSYGVNNYLTTTAPFEPYLKITDVPRPSSTVHFLYMAEEGEYAGADHPHIENWGASPYAPIRAARQVEIHAHGGPAESFQSVTNYGFLDGHAETNTFEEVYTDYDRNKFDPAVAR